MQNFFLFNRRYFHLVGLPYLEEPQFKNNNQKRLWKILKSTGDVSLVVNTASVTIALFLTNDMGKSFTSAMGFAYNWGYFVRHILYRVNKERLEEIYSSLNVILNDSRSSSRGSEFMRMYRNDARIVETVSSIRATVELSASVLCCVGFAVQGFFGEPNVPCNAWYPFDQTVQLNAFVVCIVQLVAFFTVVARVSSSDSFLFMVIVSLSTQLKHLQRTLPTVIDRKQHKTDELRWQECRQWLVRHRETLRITDQFKKFLSPFLVITYAVVLSIILFCGVIMTSTETWNWNQKITLMGTGILNLTQLFITCKAGDTLLDMQSNLPAGGFTNDMMSSAQKYKTAYGLILLRSQKLIKLTAYNLHPLSSETFSVLCRATFSYYLAIIQISQRSRSVS